VSVTGVHPMGERTAMLQFIKKIKFKKFKGRGQNPGSTNKYTKEIR